MSRGVVVVSEITGVHSSRVHRWTYPKERGGTGGTIPSQHQQVLLDGALARGLGLRPSDFFELPDDDSPAPESPRSEEVRA